ADVVDQFLLGRQRRRAGPRAVLAGLAAHAVLAFPEAVFLAGAFFEPGFLAVAFFVVAFFFPDAFFFAGALLAAPSPSLAVAAFLPPPFAALPGVLPLVASSSRAA